MRVRILLFIAKLLGVPMTYGPTVTVEEATKAFEDVMRLFEAHDNDCDFCVGDHGDYICTRECACKCHNEEPVDLAGENDPEVLKFREWLSSTPTRLDSERNTRPRNLDN